MSGRARWKDARNSVPDTGARREVHRLEGEVLDEQIGKVGSSCCRECHGVDAHTTYCSYADAYAEIAADEMMDAP